MLTFTLHFPVGFLLLQLFAVAAAKKVCYGKYGCFSDGAPFNTNILKLLPRPLPQTPEEMETKYFLFTRRDRIGQTVLDDSDASKLMASTYDGSKKTILIIHGWTGKPLESPWVKAMKDALLEKEDANVIITGWQKGASDIYYPQAVGNTRLVGAMVAEFIKFVNTETNNTPETFHVIGFSLGAQVAGYAGKRFQEITKKKIARITGLDPASPGYKGEHIDVRLDATDGAFVDVIHSDCPRVGTPSKSGKFDFWPNGGGTQPGCAIKKKRGAVAKKGGAVAKKGGAVAKKGGAVDNVFKLVGCEHYRAHQYFIESIKSSKCLFRACPCNSWTDFTHGKCMDKCGTDGSACPEMGYNAFNYKDLAEGDYYLYTNAEAPYCVPRYMYVKLETGRNTLRIGDGYNPRVKIYGRSGDSGEIKFKGRLRENSAQQFVAPIKSDIGDLKSVAVRNDLTGSPADPWKVKKVTLRYVDDDVSYSACFNENVFISYVKKNLFPGNASCKRKHSIKRPKNKRRHKFDLNNMERVEKAN